MPNVDFSLDDFSGVARLFPLPDLVMFPHVAQPLHVFESRYVEMLEDAMATDRLIATGLLLPGWETEYESRPPINPILCIGRVMSQSRTEDGRYNILLAGLSRAELIRELPPKRSFRQAKAKLIPDYEPKVECHRRAEIHRELVDCFRRFIPENQVAQQQLDEVLGDHLHLGPLTDLMAYSLPLDLSFKQMLLAEADVLQRARLLLEDLTSHAEQHSLASGFPPKFSAN